MRTIDKTLHDHFVKALRELYTAEQEIVKALPKMADAATNEDLRAGFEEHLEQTREHVARLEEVFQELGEEAETLSNPVITALLNEGEKVIAEEQSDAKDAALIAAAQKVEHYEIACYGTVLSWAKTMKHDNVLSQLSQTLDEEKDTDAKLSSLAEGNLFSEGVNEEAVE